MNLSLAAFIVSALLLVGMGHALPCELNAPYSTLETGGQGCKYVPEVCRGLPEQLLATASEDTEGRKKKKGVSSPNFHKLWERRLDDDWDLSDGNGDRAYRSGPDLIPSRMQTGVNDGLSTLI
ncbi:hypothetical protein DFH09DRAFT_1102024 [Mycena vulgaris]|nr:hypothetical protein DFH09DRAFT_1102024 [Mycena vulgaris]